MLSQGESTDHGDGDHGEARENDSTESRTNCSSAAPTPSKLDHGQKRQRHDKGNSGESEDERSAPHSKRSKVSQPKGIGRPRFLACPFWRLDPVKHWGCFAKKTRTISYVKQHLSRQHSADFYCQRCYKIFSDAEIRDRHVLSVWCAPRDPSAILEGVSHDQKTQLSRKSKGSMEDQWYAMWNILFPGRQQPSSVYIDSDQSEDFCRIREFSQREGVTILRDELRTSGIVLRPKASDDQLDETIQRAMDSMFEYFRLGQISTDTRCSGQSDRDDRASGQSKQQETPAGSSADNGVVLHSLGSSNRAASRISAPSLISGREEVMLQQSTGENRQPPGGDPYGPQPAHGNFQHNKTCLIILQITVGPAVTSKTAPAQLLLGRSTVNDVTPPLQEPIYENIPPQAVTEHQQQVDTTTTAKSNAAGSFHGTINDPQSIHDDFALEWEWKSQDFEELLQNIP